ncbi:hypothetical protein Cantr_02187 [Candida viswanathii]|uniref:DUF3533 domain-containing protein n=1 Tax=Candida viswanathii TaxID=5486 RepID=A0A367YKW6_9ASCO|nr:hypothetical protein Cantr_02187 [Candida viswanathii]
MFQNDRPIDPLDPGSPSTLEDDELVNGGIAADAMYRVQTAEHEAGERKREQQDQEHSSREKSPEVKQDENKKLTWKERCQEYYQAAPKFIFAYVLVFSVYLGFMSIYWGSLFQRDIRYQNVKYLVVNEDAKFEYNGEETFTFLMLSNLENLNSHNNTPYEEVLRQVHHQKFWGGIYIAPNSTRQIYNSFYTANATFMTSGAINQTIIMIYKTGQHFSALS